MTVLGWIYLGFLNPESKFLTTEINIAQYWISPCNQNQNSSTIWRRGYHGK